MDEEFLQIGRSMAEEAFGIGGTECVILYSSMQIEDAIRRSQKPATKKRLNTMLKRSGDAFKAAMERLVQRDCDAAIEIIEPFTNSDMPSLWICFSREEVVKRVAHIYDRLSSNLSAHDAYDLGGREHVGSIVFWLDR
ncbi:MAG: hypothetical protein KF886_24825 [Candidatus Hydrogenedentes bacterium]|nr:hypothetical protein [Candidatus Hydrogenedentota bacterium]